MTHQERAVSGRDKEDKLQWEDRSAMVESKRSELRGFEGRTVSLALADGSRYDDVSLVSARSRTIWIYTNGEDRFLPVEDVIDVWEACPIRSAA